MKKLFAWIPLILMLSGCGTDPAMEQALAFRGSVLGAQETRLQAQIRADYIDRVEEFTLDCQFDSAGAMTFRVAEPQEIRDITGLVTAQQGTLTYDGTALAFPLVASGQLSPVSAPWVVMKALRTGYITAVGREGDTLRLTIDDSFADDALTVEVWIGDNQLTAAEISQDGRRQVTLEIEAFTLG